MADLTETQKRKRDEIAETLKADPDFQPQEGRTKEESAFAVATDAALKDNPGHEGNPMDEILKTNLLEQARALRFSGDNDLEAKGVVLEVATSRGDVPAVRKILGDLVKLSDELGDAAAKEVYSYLRESVKEEAASSA